MTNTIKKHFPLLTKFKNLVYLDNASTTQTPAVVIKTLENYYRLSRANVSRGLYPLSVTATTQYENARQILANFIGAKKEQIVFTAGATAGLNMLARSLTTNLKKGDAIVLSRAEHHANLIPWQQLAKQLGFRINFIELDKNNNLDLSSAKKIINKKTKIVSITHVSNVLGVENPITKIVQLAHKVKALVVVDGCQAVAHQKINVQKLACDFYVLSGHKMYGPTGSGLIYGRDWSKISPSVWGGEMVEAVTYDKASWTTGPQRFEAGTPSIADSLALATAAQFLSNNRCQPPTGYLFGQLQKLSFIKIISPQKNNIGLVSFAMTDVHAHDVAEMLGQLGICVRAGHHCAMPLHQYLGLSSSLRVSLGLYNDKKDIDTLIAGLKIVHNKLA